MSRRRWAGLALGLSLIGSGALSAQALTSPAGTAGASSVARGAALEISVITFGPGEYVFERFGHNALRIRDRATGEDVSYNWGMFSFDEPNFLGRFLSGDTRYWVEGIPTGPLLAAYERMDRETVIQRLSLTPEAAWQLDSAVRDNATEAKKYYRYDYYRDNCSTRLRDALDKALGGALSRRFSAQSTTWSYRSESVRLTEPTRAEQLGIDLALGPRADRPLSVWEASFIPMRLRDALRTVSVATEGGPAIPLVASEDTVYRAKRLAEPPERRGLTLGMWGPILGAWMLLLTPVSAASRRRTRGIATVVAGLWYGLTGLLGLTLILMWSFSAHVFWYGNLTALLLSPLGLLIAIPAARAIWRGKASRMVRWTIGVIVASTLLVLLLAPFVAQQLGGPLLMIVPAQLGLALALWRHLRVAELSDATQA